MSNAWIGSWLFVIGSFLFTGDASIDAFETCSFRAAVRLLACLLFTVGCLSPDTSSAARVTEIQVVGNQ